MIGDTAITLPSGYKEVYVRSMIEVASQYYAVVFHLLKTELEGYSKRYIGGLANGNNCQFMIVGTETSVRLFTAVLNGTDYTSSAHTAVLYR